MPEPWGCLVLGLCLEPGGAKEVFALDFWLSLGVLLNYCPFGPLCTSRVAEAGALYAGGARGHGDIYQAIPMLET